MAKIKKRYKKRKNNPTKYILLLLILTGLILFTTSKIISLEKYANYYQINEHTSKYISYQYKEDNIVELKTKVLNNKSKHRSNYYQYQINNNTDNDIEYQVLLMPINIEDSNDLYVYITDDKNNKLSEVRKYNELKSIGSNKIIYNGKLNKHKTSKQRLKIWSDKNRKSISFKISTKIK